MALPLVLLILKMYMNWRLNIQDVCGIKTSIVFGFYSSMVLRKFWFGLGTKACRYVICMGKDKIMPNAGNHKRLNGVLDLKCLKIKVRLQFPLLRCLVI